MFFGYAGGSSRWKVHLLPCISSPVCDQNMCVWKTVSLNKTFWNRCKCFTPCTHYFQIIDQKSFWRFTVTQVNTCKFKTAGQQILNQECDSRFHNKKLLQFHESSSFFFFSWVKTAVWKAQQKAQIDTKTSYIFRNLSKKGISSSEKSGFHKWAYYSNGKVGFYRDTNKTFLFLLFGYLF